MDTNMCYHDSCKLSSEEAASDLSLPQKIRIVSPLYMIMDIMTSPLKILLQNDNQRALPEPTSKALSYASPHIHIFNPIFSLISSSTPSTPSPSSLTHPHPNLLRNSNGGNPSNASSAFWLALTLAYLPLCPNA